MDVKSVQEKVKAFTYKYRYAALVLCVGIGLMCLPVTNKETVQQETEQTEPQVSISQELADILSSIEGAGNVRVLLTVAAGEETVYQTDRSSSESETSNTTQVDTVTVTDSQRNQTGLIRQVNPPVYQGAIIVCQGADRPAVQLAIVNAVSRATGLSSDKISVIKMK